MLEKQYCSHSTLEYESSHLIHEYGDHWDTHVCISKVVALPSSCDWDILLAVADIYLSGGLRVPYLLGVHRGHQHDHGQETAAFDIAADFQLLLLSNASQSFSVHATSLRLPTSSRWDISAHLLVHFVPIIS